MYPRKSSRCGIILALATVGVGMAIGIETDPEKALQELQQMRATRMREAREKQITLDREALEREIESKAKTYCQGIDPATIDPKQGLAWAKLFSTAAMLPQARDAAKRFLEAKPDPKARFEAQMLLLEIACDLGEENTLLEIMPTLHPSDPLQAYIFAMRVAYTGAEMIAKAKGAEAALTLLNEAENKIDYDLFKSEEEKRSKDTILATFAERRADYLVALNRKQEALETLEKGKKLIQSDNKIELRGLEAKQVQIRLTGAPAPALTVERSYGKFKGLEAYKGKVILLDFFAHWCGPCIRSFPALRQMYIDLHDKGLEIFGVTTYYGFYKDRRKLTRDEEFARMKEFIAEHQIQWPVLYGEPSNFESYGVSGIPHVVLIDKESKIHFIKVGYSEEGLAQLREKVEQLLK